MQNRWTTLYIYIEYIYSICNCSALLSPSFLINNKVISQNAVLARLDKDASSEWEGRGVFTRFEYPFSSNHCHCWTSRVCTFFNLNNNNNESNWPSNGGWSHRSHRFLPLSLPLSLAVSLSLSACLVKICLFRISKPKVIDLINCHRHVARSGRAGLVWSATAASSSHDNCKCISKIHRGVEWGFGQLTSDSSSSSIS